jgi:hypothetical protein
MQQLILEHSTRIEDEDGGVYIPRIYGLERGDGTWMGWVEFHPVDNEGVFLRTDQETSQPNRASLVYWASGLEPIYLEGAFDRAAEFART